MRNRRACGCNRCKGCSSPNRTGHCNRTTCASIQRQRPSTIYSIREGDINKEYNAKKTELKKRIEQVNLEIAARMTKKEEELKEKYTQKYQSNEKKTIKDGETQIISTRQTVYEGMYNEGMRELDDTRQIRAEEFVKAEKQKVADKEDEYNRRLKSNDILIQSIHQEQLTKREVLIKQYIENLTPVVFKWFGYEDPYRPKVRFVDDYKLAIEVVLPNLVKGVQKDWTTPENVRNVFKIVKRKTNSPLVDNMALSIGVKTK